MLYIHRYGLTFWFLDFLISSWLLPVEEPPPFVIGGEVISGMGIGNGGDRKVVEFASKKSELNLEVALYNFFTSRGIGKDCGQTLYAIVKSEDNNFSTFSDFLIEAEYQRIMLK